MKREEAEGGSTEWAFLLRDIDTEVAQRRMGANRKTNRVHGDYARIGANVTANPHIGHLRVTSKVA
jgi:hypothetical protein